MQLFYDHNNLPDAKKLKDGRITDKGVGNIVIEAPDRFAAVAKLMQRYPGCEILEGREG